MIDRYKKSLMSQLISYSDKNVRLFANNLFEKIRQLGILPEYIERNKEIRDFYDIVSLTPFLTDLREFSFGKGYWGDSLQIINEAGRNIGKSWELSFEYFTENTLQEISLFDQNITFSNGSLTVYGAIFNIVDFREGDVNKIKVVRNGDLISVYHQGDFLQQQQIVFSLDTLFFNLYTVEDNLGADNPIIGNIVITDRGKIKNIWVLDFFEEGQSKDIGQGDYDFFSIWYSLCFYIGLLNNYRNKLILVNESSDGLRRFLDSREVFHKSNSSFDELLYIFNNWVTEIEKRGTELQKLPYDFSKEIGSTYFFKLPGFNENKVANSGVAVCGDINFSLINSIDIGDNYEFSFDLLVRSTVGNITRTFDFKLFNNQADGSYLRLSTVSVSETGAVVNIQKYKLNQLVFSIDHTITSIESIKKVKLISVGSLFALYIDDVVIYSSTNSNNSGNYTFDSLIYGDTAIIANIKALRMNSDPENLLHNQLSVTDNYVWECNDGSGIFIWCNRGYDYSAIYASSSALAYTDIWLRDPVFNNTGYLGIDGELRRMVDYDFGEFTYELSGESELGFVMDISSPISEEANLVNLNKAFEKGSIKRLNLYPISFDPVIPIIDNGWISYQLPTGNTSFCGVNSDLISDPDWKVNTKYKPTGLIPFIPIPVSLIGDSFDGYEVSFVINFNAPIDLKFGILPYDNELDFMPNSVLTYLMGSIDNYFMDEINFSLLQGNDLLIRGVYSPNKISSASERLNIDFGTNLYSNDNLISFISPFIAFRASGGVAADIKIKDISVRFLTLNTSKGIIDPKNNIFGYMKNKTGRFNKDILKEISDKFDPYDCTSNIKLI